MPALALMEAVPGEDMFTGELETESEPTSFFCVFTENFRNVAEGIGGGGALGEFPFLSEDDSNADNLSPTIPDDGFLP